MNENNHQNCCLMLTSVTDDGRTEVYHIPLCLDISVVEYFMKNGTCTNNQAIVLESDLDPHDFWKVMWDELEARCE